MPEAQLRLACLQLAHRDLDDKSEVVERARAYYEFVIGQRDAAAKEAPR